MSQVLSGVVVYRDPDLYVCLRDPIDWFLSRVREALCIKDETRSEYVCIVSCKIVVISLKCDWGGGQ